MTTAERLVKLTQSLPEQIQMEVLDFAEILNQRYQLSFRTFELKPD